MLSSDAPVSAVDHTEPQVEGNGGIAGMGDPNSLVIAGIDVEDIMFVAKRKV